MNSAEKAVKIVVCIALLFGILVVGLSALQWAVGDEAIAGAKKLRGTDRGSSAWGSGGSGWGSTNSAGTVIETAKSPVAHETTDPDPGHQYIGGQPRRQLKQFVSYDQTLSSAPNLTGARPGFQARAHVNTHNPQPDNFARFPFDQWYQHNRRTLRH